MNTGQSPGGIQGRWWPQPAPWQPTTTVTDGHLGIRRGNYIALQAPDPRRAAEFAVGHMGMELVHVDANERHYLAGHGLDPYSVVYTKGERAVDHVSYVVADAAALSRAETTLSQLAVDFERIEGSEMWRHKRAVRFRAPTGTTIELTLGVEIEIPMTELVEAPQVAPAPLAFDHVILRTRDIESLTQWSGDVLGLRESARIIAPDDVPILSFFRGSALFHCFGAARSDHDGLHHFELSMKNDRALFAAYEKMSADPAVDIFWGPVRHGCGQNIAFYFRDAVGNIVEYSAEEELILGDAYEVQHWSITNARSEDEWGSEVPHDAFA